MVVMVVAMELMVFDTTVGVAFRVLAWMRLIKSYATMRADDLQRLRAEVVNWALQASRVSCAGPRPVP